MKKCLKCPLKYRSYMNLNYSNDDLFLFCRSWTMCVTCSMTFPGFMWDDSHFWYISCCYLPCLYSSSHQSHSFSFTAFYWQNVEMKVVYLKMFYPLCTGEEVRDPTRWFALCKEAGVLHGFCLSLSSPFATLEFLPPVVSQPATCSQTPAAAGGDGGWVVFFMFCAVMKIPYS